MLDTEVDSPAPSEAAPIPDTRRLNTWIEVSRSAYERNLRFLRGCVGPEVELSAVVKSNAYGHGLSSIARLAIDAGADSFCVHALDEALALRADGHGRDILIMGHVPLARLDEVVEHDLRVVVYQPESVEHLAAHAERLSRPARLHVKIETGTHRQGVEGQELKDLLDVIRSHEPKVLLEGIYTHFANIEDTTDHSYARRQLERYRRALGLVEGMGFAPTKKHAACSAATVLFPETHFDLVRVGISQYGFWSSKETLLSHEHSAHGEAGADAGLEPILTWKTRVSQVKWVGSGAAVGYGCSFVTTRRSRIAILPVGYSDGYDRRLSNASYVLIGGRRAPVCGRICMNLTMVDVTDIPDVGLEDEVVLLGRQGGEQVSAEVLAGLIGTIHYEVVTRLASHIPRLVVA